MFSKSGSGAGQFETTMCLFTVSVHRFDGRPSPFPRVQAPLSCIPRGAGGNGRAKKEHIGRLRLARAVLACRGVSHRWSAAFVRVSQSAARFGRLLWVGLPDGNVTRFSHFGLE